MLIETVEFFPPMVDDPEVFGEIAAANALSDIYAMGGEPKIAMSLMCFPSCLDIKIMRRIMEGAIRKTEKAGVVIAGGHTLSDREPKFGLAVTGFADKDSVWTNKGAKAGDSIVLTKKLGVGLLMTAHKAGETEAVEAIAQMRKLNKEAKENASGLEIHAATDVTGFSLIGHSYEAAYASGVSAVISFERLRYLEGAEEAARYGFVPEGRYTNEDYLQDKVSIPSDFSVTDVERLASAAKRAEGISRRVAQVDEGAYPELRTGEDLDRSDAWACALKSMDEKIAEQAPSRDEIGFIDTVGGADTLDEPDNLELDTAFIPFRTPAGHPEVVDTDSYVDYLIEDEFSKNACPAVRRHSRHFLRVLEGGTHSSRRITDTGSLEGYAPKHFAVQEAIEA